MNHTDAVRMLESVAARGFASEPVTHWLSKDETAQYVKFTDEEKREMRMFLGFNPHLSRIGRHPIPSFVGDPPSHTISLLGRISYAMGGNHITPDYVSGLAAELHESLDTHSALWEISELNRLSRGQQ